MNLISRKKGLLVGLLTLCLALLVFLYGFLVTSQIKQIHQKWSNYDSDVVLTYYTLSRIERSFGYGGFIHNFKNMVLRLDASRIPSIDQNLAETYAAITEYEQLESSKHDVPALIHIRAVVDEYSAKYAIAKEMLAAGYSATEIDSKVKVNDKPALAAIANLSRHALNHAKTYQQGIGHDLSYTLYFLQWGIALIPLILLTGGLVLWFLRQLIIRTQETQKAKLFLSDVLEATPDALLIIDEDGFIRRTNIQAERLLGYQRDELLSMTVEDLMPGRYRGHHVAQRQQTFSLRTKKSFRPHTHFIIKTKEGQEIPIDISIGYTRQDSEVLAITSIRDIRERKKAEERLRLSQRIFEDTVEAILITDTNKCIVDMNDAFCRVTGYSRGELLGNTPSIFRSGRHNDVFYHAIEESLDKTDHWQGEVWDKHKDGHIFPLRNSISVVRDDYGHISHYVAVMSDISTRKEHEAKLKDMALHDPLTGLANRILFYTKLNREMARAQREGHRLAVVYIDLDGFKKINDTLGHDAGDQLLKKVAREILSNIREYDTAARLGGDEFALIIPNADSIMSELTARIIEGLSITVEEAGKCLSISASAGIAIYPDDASTRDELLYNADTAMYYAKQHGRNNYKIFNKTMLTK
ncbi:MAG: diguanylate cyclase [Gammaproteobacteria bacterium]|nr:diguanylate cyclase [Gammaproteobacteria bacterium]